MSHVEVQEHATGIRVSSAAWQVEHLLEAGGCWSSITFTNGSGRNLLRKPASSAIRFVRPDPQSESGIFTAFLESNDKKPVLRAERTAEGIPVVVAEGTFQDERGIPIPVGFRRRTEYHEFGLIWTSLEIMSDSGCDGVVEIRAWDLALRSGMTDCFVRFHPTQAGGADLLGGRGWFDLTRTGSSTPFLSRYTPLQILCFERGVEGLDIFPDSNLAHWDCAFKPDIGLGLYMVSQNADGTTLELDPYCMAYRRMKMNLQGRVTLRLGVGLPCLKPSDRNHNTIFHASTGSDWATDNDIAQLAQSGVRLIRFHNDYREGGQFWHDGVYPPYDEANMNELRRVIAAAHRNGMKIIPYLSLKELHPAAPEYTKHGKEWMHMAAPSLDMIHTWVGSGEYGALMCLKSGWLDSRKRSVDTILSDLPWDGLYLDWTTFHPCCHPAHARGPFHTDMEEFLHFLFYCRQRIGKDGTLFLHLSGLPSIVAENLADLVFIFEDQPGLAPLPGQFPPQCDFIPIAPRQLVGEPAPGSENARRFVMAGHLQGHPPCTHAPARGFSEESLREMAAFGGIDLSQYTFRRGSDRAVETGHPQVYVAAWSKPDGAVFYVGNFHADKRQGNLNFSEAVRLFGKKTLLKWELRTPGDNAVKDGTISAMDLASGNGLPYRLQAMASCLFIFR